MAPVLVHYDPSQAIRLAGDDYDDDNYEVEAILSYVLPIGTEHPIAFGCAMSETMQS